MAENGPKKTPESESALLSVARSIGAAAGKVAALTGAKTAEAPANAELYKADYLGSGTFIIRKPQRKGAKLRQSRLKAPRRGARK